LSRKPCLYLWRKPARNGRRTCSDGNPAKRWRAGKLQENGGISFRKLSKLKKRHPIVREVRGKGLMIGMEIVEEGGDIVKRCMNKGVLINCTCGNILRFLPPLTIGEGEIDTVVSVLDEAMEDR
jgi:Ornithine/acetylornithine aminotransferase